jgi:hypothetical protein
MVHAERDHNTSVLKATGLATSIARSGEKLLGGDRCREHLPPLAQIMREA